MRSSEKRPAVQELAATAGALRRAWRGRQEEGTRFIFRRGREEVRLELGVREDRFALLLLAILAGAKVQESIAAATLNDLREQGLAQPDRLAARAPADEEAVRTVLRETYRALASKAQKAEALFSAATRVAQLYDGDPLNIHLPGQPGQKTLEALWEFDHLKSRAYWVCREMRRHGLWPDLEPQACAAVDTPVKLALWRLGYVGKNATILGEIPAGECLQAIDQFFGGDSLPLFYQGERLCRPGRPALCAAECQVAIYCRRQNHSESHINTEQAFGLSTGACG